MMCCICFEEADTGICVFHTAVGGDETRWSEVNRCMCEGIHRGRWHPRLPKDQREFSIVEDEYRRMCDVAAG